jgi:hypothetical protein
VDAGVWQQVEPSFAKVVNPLDVVRKASADPAKPGFRAILDMRWVNYHVPDMPFRMEDLSDIAQVVSPGDWMFKVDLSDAFYHCPLAPSAWPEFCIR